MSAVWIVMLQHEDDELNVTGFISHTAARDFLADTVEADYNLRIEEAEGNEETIAELTEGRDFDVPNIRSRTDERMYEVRIDHDCVFRLRQMIVVGGT